MKNVNPWWLVVAVFAGLLIGIFLAIWYITNKIKKLLGIKSLKEFEAMIKNSKEIEKKMKKGDINEMLNDPQLKKQMEEIRKRFGKSI